MRNLRDSAVVIVFLSLGCATALAKTDASPRKVSVLDKHEVEPVVGSKGAQVEHHIAKEPHKEAPKEAPKPSLADWLKAHAPSGATVVTRDGIPHVQHTVKSGDTYRSIAKSYLDLSTVYLADDYAMEIKRSLNDKYRGIDAPLRQEVTIDLPALLTEVPKTGDDARLGWPKDQSLRGLYVRGSTAAGKLYHHILENMAARDYNAIVLDLRDYDGPITFPSRTSLATETKATKGAPIRDLARTIRFAHEKGIRVIARIACFEDELMAKAKTDLSVRGKSGGVYRIGWLDPNNETAQNYVIDLAKEAMDAGADEVELDYVRYPVLGIKNADFRLEEKKLTKIDVIRNFVRRVHDVTSARKVPLSLDVFGVVAHGQRSDIEALGQDPAVLAKECEALSPMVYPSHYNKGFMGFEEPGDHPEIVGFGTKKTIEQLGENKNETIVRPWLQAVSWKSPTYSPSHLRAQMDAAEKNGGKGWLLWNPSQNYGYAWQARAVKKKESAGH